MAEDATPPPAQDTTPKGPEYMPAKPADDLAAEPAEDVVAAVQAANKPPDYPAKGTVKIIEKAAVSAVEKVTDTAVDQSAKTNKFAQALLGTVFWTTVWRLFSVILILAAIVGLYKVLFGKSAPALQLSDGQYMRGLITIVLLVVSLALVVVIIFTSLYADNDESTFKRVNQGREVLTPLFGILGTIIGLGVTGRARVATAGAG